MHKSTMRQAPRFYSIKDAADLLSVSTKTVYRLVKSGALAAVRVGHQLRIAERDLQAYLRGERVL